MRINIFFERMRVRAEFTLHAQSGVHGHVGQGAPDAGHCGGVHNWRGDQLRSPVRVDIELEERRAPGVDGQHKDHCVYDAVKQADLNLEETEKS